MQLLQLGYAPAKRLQIKKTWINRLAKFPNRVYKSNTQSVFETLAVAIEAKGGSTKVQLKSQKNRQRPLNNNVVNWLFSEHMERYRTYQYKA